MGFNLDDYEPVADRVAAFWKDHPEGSIITQLVTENEAYVIVRATVRWGSKLVDNVCEADGYARQSLTGAKAGSAEQKAPLETCETSAIGRALANAGYQTKGRASREEMAKVQTQTVDLLHLVDDLNDEEREVLKFVLSKTWPGLGLKEVPTDLVSAVTEVVVDIVKDRYAQPVDTADVSEYSEEPF